MQSTEIRRVMGSALLALALSTTMAVTPVHAQAPGATTAAQTGTMDDNDDDDGMDLGWIGLLGLAGLLGLRRKDEHHVTRVDTTTGAGTTRPRV
jgi:MYXO-CTERM domain-containing protein